MPKACNINKFFMIFHIFHESFFKSFLKMIKFNKDIV